MDDAISGVDLVDQVVTAFAKQVIEYLARDGFIFFSHTWLGLCLGIRLGGLPPDKSQGTAHHETDYAEFPHRHYLLFLSRQLLGKTLRRKWRSNSNARWHGIAKNFFQAHRFPKFQIIFARGSEWPVDRVIPCFGRFPA